MKRRKNALNLYIKRNDSYIKKIRRRWAMREGEADGEEGRL